MTTTLTNGLSFIKKTTQEYQIFHTPIKEERSDEIKIEVNTGGVIKINRRKLLNGECLEKIITGVKNDLMFLIKITLGLDKKACGNPL